MKQHLKCYLKCEWEFCWGHYLSKFLNTILTTLWSMYLLTPFFEWGTWEAEILSKVPQLLGSRAGWKKSESHIRLFATPWTVACQAPLSMEFPSQEYWRGLSFPSPKDLSDPGIKPWSQAGCRFFTIAGRFFTISATRVAPAELGLEAKSIWCPSLCYF